VQLEEDTSDKMDKKYPDTQRGNNVRKQQNLKINMAGANEK